MRDKFDWFYLTYHKLSPVSKRFDALRYMVLYEYGGVFVDISTEAKKSFVPLIARCVECKGETEAPQLVAKAPFRYAD